MKPAQWLRSFFAPLSVTFFLLTGCQPGEPQPAQPAPKNGLLGTWELADLENIRFEGGASQNTTKGMMDLVKGQMLKNGLVLSFFPDGTYTEISGGERKPGDTDEVAYFSNADFMDTKACKYAQGQWKASGNNSKLTLSSQGGSAAEAREVLSLDEKFMVLHMVEGEFSCDFRFRRTGKPLEDIAADPFCPANNQWRLAPAAAETEEQLRARMRNHVQHYLTLLEASLERKQNSVSLKYSPSIIQIYSGGIGIREKQYWDEAFLKCFHSPQDAQKGVDLYTQILHKNLSIGAGTGDWVKDDANLLRLLLTELQ